MPLSFIVKVDALPRTNKSESIAMCLWKRADVVGSKLQGPRELD